MSNGLDAFSGAYKGHYEDDNTLMQQVILQNMHDDLIGKSVLELGIGHGLHFREIADIAADYTAIEGSPEIIRRFNETVNRDAKIRVIEGFFENYVADKRYDCIILNFILEHVDSDAAILTRYRDFLAEGGCAFVVVPNSESMHKRIAYEAGILDTMYFLPESELRFGHKRFYTHDSLRRLVRDAGYHIVYGKGIFFKPLTSAQLASLQLTPAVYRALGTVAQDYPELCNAMMLKLSADG